jgi:hypothetical protein
MRHAIRADLESLTRELSIVRATNARLDATLGNIDAENTLMKRALREIAECTALVFDETEEREVQVWMDADDCQEIARQALAEVDVRGGGGR